MGVPVKVWLGGEGRHELGGRVLAPPDERPGVIEALLRRVERSGWHVLGVMSWRHIKKYETGVHKAEERNVLGLVLTAAEQGAEVVAFSRDVDSDPERARRVEAAIEKAAQIIKLPAPIAIIGGVARPAIEGWILALSGIRDSDDMSRPRCAQCMTDHAIESSTESFVRIVGQARLDQLPPGCDSLRTWLDRAKQLPVVVHGVA